MESTGKIVRNNLLIFLLYTLLVHAFTGREAAFTGSIIAYIHAGGIFLIGILMAIFGEKESRSQGGALILSALLIAIIGFSVCLGTFDLRLH